MADPKTPAAEKAMTADQAAKLVRRTVQVKDGDKLIAKQVPVAADEVLDFKDYGTHVAVVTTDGQKLTGAVKA